MTKTKTQQLSRKASGGREERISADVQVSAGHFRHQRIKLAIDVHLEFCVVARQIDNASVERPRKMSHEELMKFVSAQLKLGREVYSCYEAGCFGYGLHRQLETLGVKNVVIRPQDL